MTVTTKKLTIRLSEDHLDFVKRYAKQQCITVTEVFERYLRYLSASTIEPGPEVKRISGILPARLDAKSKRKNLLLRRYV